MRALIDTCVIIDALQERRPFADEAKEVFRAAAACLFDGYIAAKASADIYYIMHRHTHDGMAARETLRKIYTLFSLLDTTAEDCINALALAMSDYEDAIMSATAARAGMDCIVTRNIRDYAVSPVPAYTPDEFLSLIRRTS
ncbi:PIN domain-containing protein [Cloacibacillus sp. An23]|uniref:PIN domain-containing protein n=1 Tax=Cloacibacillus sp. An23 TaxID=1965591 RepID=UPI000B3693F1|nr:PIN domain-containing protein [Cloacibacillus sp. An23]OUO93443.1 PIN domain nuclease [Cloacibacillus sp. An23]